MNEVYSVLIVDDNPGDIDLLKIALEEAGCFPYIFTANDGEEALDLFRSHQHSRDDHADRFPPLVILLDVNMPRVDGFEFLEEYSKLATQPPLNEFDMSVVLMVTSSNDPRDRERSKSFEMVKDFICKPPSKADALRIAERFGSPAN